MRSNECMCDVMHKTCTPYYRPSTVFSIVGNAAPTPQHLNEQISETITPNSVKFCILTTNWLLYKCAKFYLKRVIIVEVIRKIKVVSLLFGHGVYNVYIMKRGRP